MNFGNPRKPEVMWEFSESVDGMAQACRELGVPVVSGNVSLYNETGDSSILPTPGLAMVGLWEGAAPRLRGRWTAGRAVALIGGEGTHLGASLFIRAMHGLRKTGDAPPVDFDRERALGAALRRLVRQGLVEVAHDLGDGGLAVALAECALEVGGRFDVATSDAALFGEDHGRAIIAYDLAREAEVLAACAGLPVRVLGATGGERLEVADISVTVAALREAWGESFPRWVDG